jgi:Spy/CpxP family protein refolding chaperone
MESRLDLRDDQRKQIQDILRQGRDESDAIRRELRPRLESQLETTRKRIAAVLTDEQRAKFEQLVSEDRRRAERFFLEGPPPPPFGGPPPENGGGPPPPR